MQSLIPLLAAGLGLAGIAFADTEAATAATDSGAAAPTQAVGVPPNKVPSVQEVLTALGYDRKSSDAFQAGEIVSSDLKRAADNELTAVAAMTVRSPLEAVCGYVTAPRNAVRGAKVLEAGEVSEPPDASQWQGLGYAPSETAEVAELLSAAPGETFNLSSEEFSWLRERLGGLPPDALDTQAAASEAYREILIRRFESYLDEGLDGIAPYARSGGKSVSPAEELRTALASVEALLRSNFPAFAQALVARPATSHDGIVERFYWAKRSVQDRPAFVLIHEIAEPADDFCLWHSRQYYVGHSYNTLITTLLAIPNGENTAVFQGNRTRTDQISGLFSRIARSVGEDRLKTSLERHFEQLREHSTE